MGKYLNENLTPVENLLNQIYYRKENNRPTLIQLADRELTIDQLLIQLYDKLKDISCITNDRNLSILKDRFNSKLTYKQIGEKYNISSSRVMQIINKIYRIMTRALRHNIDFAKINNAVENGESIIIIDILPDPPANIESANEFLIDYKNTDLSNCDNFSVRTYNCLMRAGIRNTSQLEGLKYSDLTKVRNLGQKSFKEIVDFCEKHGINLKGEYVYGGYTPRGFDKFVPDPNINYKDTDIENIPLSHRTCNALIKWGITRTSQFVGMSYTELLDIYGIGNGSLSEIIKFCKMFDIPLVEEKKKLMQ